MGKETLESILDSFMNENLLHMILSNPVQKDGIRKVKIRPMVMKGTLIYQAEEFTDKQAFHKNLQDGEIQAYIKEQLSGRFRQAEVKSVLGSATVLVSKKGQMTVKVKRIADVSDPDVTRGQAARKREAKEPVAGEQVVEGRRQTSAGQMGYGFGQPGQAKIVPDLSRLEHNRKKRYVLEEGRPVPFLADLGVMTEEGKVVHSRYDKFRQINRFLEFIEDILPRLDKSRETVIIDFGCGKSYLTFAMYYYLHELKGYPVRIIGLDLKKDVINRCNMLAGRYGFDGLAFYYGDIASYDGVDHVDMVVTLHACDTATDFALEKAVRWGARVILSVPCCQHEYNGQMENALMKAVFSYGLIKERMAALYTDALRAQILENRGYRTQILEFIDMEHTPKNILIRAVYEGKPKKNEKEIREILDFLHVEPTLYRLLMNEQGKGEEETEKI